ncbi:uncharacterized protein DS421_5g143570 [Arachis hypogaea]|nr:uncharacterized protein DS421_5g143570 [Arachis hypogaea]
MLNCQGNTLKRWNHEFPVRLHSNFKKAPEAVFLTQIATNSNPRAQSEVKKVADLVLLMLCVVDCRCLWLAVAAYYALRLPV